MKIRPHHLRDRHHIALVRQRARSSSESAAAGVDTPPAEIPPAGFWAKQWTRGLEMNERQAALGNAAASQATESALAIPLLIALPLLVPFLIGVFRGKIDPVFAVTLVTVVLSGLVALCLGVIAPATLRRLHTPIREGELDQLLQNAGDELEREYLSLVRDAVRLQIPASAENSVRDSIEALGQAIDRIPVIASRSMDTGDLRTEAEKIRTAALEEKDPVIAESLERQALALESRIASRERSATLARRSEALHSEMLAQIEALREALFASQSGGVEGEELHRLSASARRVAMESTAVATAQQELDAPVVLVQNRLG